MKPRIFSIVIVLFNFLISNAQTKKEIGVIGGFTLQKSILPPNEMFENSFRVSSVYGINFKIIDKNKNIIKLGLCNYKYSTYLKTKFLGNFENLIFGNVISLPIEVGKQFRITKKSFLSFSIGVAPTFHLNNSLNTARVFDTSRTNITQHSKFMSTKSNDAQPNSIFILGKCSVNWKTAITNKLFVIVGVDYWQGFKPIYKLNYHWKDFTTTNIWSNETLAGNGSLLSINLGVGYSIKSKN